MSEPRPDLLPGTLELLVLRALLQGPRHGYAIARWIAGQSDSVLEVEEGSLYPALHRMEKRGLIAAKWGSSESNRRAKYYRLTRAGRSEFNRGRARWERFSEAVGRVLKGSAPMPGEAGA